MRRPATLDDVPGDVTVVIERADGTLVRDVFHGSNWAVLPLSFLLSRHGDSIRSLFLMGFGREPWDSISILCDTMIPAWPVVVAATDWSR